MPSTTSTREMTIKCKCGRELPIAPRPEDPKLEGIYRTEITYKMLCRCGRRHFTSYNFEMKEKAR